MDLGNDLHRRASSGIENVSQAEKEDVQSDAESGRLGRWKTRVEMHFDREHEIKLTAKRIIIPDWLEVNDWERNVLEILRERLKVTLDANTDWDEVRSRNSEATAVSSEEEKHEPPI